MISDCLYPLTFVPRFKERVWGGRNLERLYGKALPADRVIGESWEISDRPGDESVVREGPLAGQTLAQVIAEFGSGIMGNISLLEGRFPLLVKLLDAQERLSLQVHPPASVAGKLGGDPKTEMWFLADCAEGADIFVGLRQGVTRERFEEALAKGQIADCFHRIPTSRGQAMFLPSGRVHAIGAGNVIFEIQQNSDTTYRVHDWDRAGLDGKPRELHIDASLASIDFSDVEPSMVTAPMHPRGEGMKGRMLADSDPFCVEQYLLETGKTWETEPGGAPRVLALVSGGLRFRCGERVGTVSAGEFLLLPASIGADFVAVEPGTGWLLATPR